MDLPENGSHRETKIETPGDEEVSSAPDATSESRVRASVFLSYSHADKDTDWYPDVIEYLSQLSVSKTIEFWDDTQINPGDDWEHAIRTRLETAKAAVFLVTPTFLTSQFIAGEEVPKLLERLEVDGLAIHALIAKPCDWEDNDHPLSGFLRSHQLPHSPDRSLDEMDGPERRRVLNELVKHMRNQLGVYRQRSGQKRRDAQMEQIERSLGLELIREAAGGQNSLIYRARKGQLNLAVKAIVARAFSDTGQRILTEEFKKCLNLQNPAFLRLYEIAFPNGFCAVTTDWVPARTLARTIAEANLRGTGLRQRLWSRTTNIVLELADALSEAHSVGLRYINLNPEKIFLSSGHVRLYPVDFSAYIAQVGHGLGMLSFPLSMMEYLPPESLSNPTGRGDPLAPPSGAKEREPEHERAMQYSLGMLAVTLLEGRPPVRLSSLADVQHLMAFHADPRGWHLEGEHPLQERAWCRDIPGLARVIWRMLEPDPADRWDSLKAIVEQLVAVQAISADARAHASEAKVSYREHLIGNDAFYSRFYDKLFARSAAIEARFRGIDMARQRRMLDDAMERLLNFRPNQEEPTTLASIVESHKGMGLEPEDFEEFGRAFVAALRDEPAIDQPAIDAWEAVLWPAIEYLKDRAGPS